MKESFLLIVAIAGLLLTLSQSLLAQERYVVGKLFHTEVGGPGVIMSANFDARFNSKERLGLGYRLGAGFGIKRTGGYYSLDSDDTFVRRTYYSFPVGLNYVLGKPNKASAFEVGAVVSFLTRKVSLYTFDEYKEGNVIGSVTFMYRIMPVDGGFSFRVGFTPIIGTAGDLYPMVAVGFGYAF